MSSSSSSSSIRLRKLQSNHVNVDNEQSNQVQLAETDPGHENPRVSDPPGYIPWTTPGLVTNQNLPPSCKSGGVYCSNVCVHFTFFEAQEVAGILSDRYWDGVKQMQQHHDFLEGMLFRNIDKKSGFPYLHYTLYNRKDSCGACSALNHTPFFQDHGIFNGVPESWRDNQASYNELYTFISAETTLLPKRPSSPSTAYIICAFRTEPKTNLDQLDMLWSYWSGAEYIVENMHKCLKLKRVTFHKIRNASVPVVASDNTEGPPKYLTQYSTGTNSRNLFTYVLLCEVGEALSDLGRAREFVERLRDRQCGYIAMFVVDHSF